jgi:tRNA G18 (ribose-2'-O)-methylase SpoU
MRKLATSELHRLSPEDFRQVEKFPLIIALDNIRSMHNVGSAFRTADSFGLEALLLGGYTPTPPHRDIQKTALGATETMHWSHESVLCDKLTLLKKSGYRITAVEQTDKSISLEKMTSFEAVSRVLVFGNEVHGVSPDVISVCDDSVEIPQFGTKHSLNVSVCLGIVSWEFVKLFRKS